MKNDPTESSPNKIFLRDLKFEPQKPQILRHENKPHSQLWKETSQGVGLVRFFMTRSEAGLRSVPEVELVRAFCPETSLEELQSSKSCVTSENVALLDDRTNDGTTSISRGYLGPLNARNLYLELQKERFPAEDDRSGENPGGNAPQAKEQAPKLNADRRLVFITDLNRWTMMALISTVSKSQAGALRDSFYRHMAFESFIGLVTPHTGFPTFQLAFDLPFFALRTAPRHRRPFDPREMEDTGTLRRVTDLTFLSRRPKGSAPLAEVDCLCEAQTTVLITGLDPWRWVAYCFVDTYFDPEDTRESVDDYHTDVVTDGDGICFQPDPLVAAELDANLPILCPREYFLFVLRRRLQDVTYEWHSLTRKMRRRIDAYINSCPITSVDAPSHPDPDEAPLVRQSRDWAVQTRRILRKLIQNLTTIINYWESFNVEVTLGPMNGRLAMCLPPIRANFKQLGIFLQELEFLRQVCDDYDDGLSFHLTHEGTRDAKVQARIAGFGQIMTFVMLCLSY
ncbi:hypothetical protein AK830_g10606 [Neonectria ditissima]|uniref:Uncharacterized protein n=1 Tax=Neonectria ditissima TaxID=78410 RepID=A0A0N8H5E5_9HYPO|nr:hypothetical protein AK830_g10606 [Neonectria ditissima]